MNGEDIIMIKMQRTLSLSDGSVKKDYAPAKRLKIGKSRNFMNKKNHLKTPEENEFVNMLTCSLDYSTPDLLWESMDKWKIANIVD
jgi:hypothetical protein